MAMRCEYSIGPARTTTLRFANPSRSLSVEEMDITDSTSTKHFMKGRPLVARRSTMTHSALQTQARGMVVMVAVMVAPLRLNALVWRFGALGYHDINANALHGTCWGTSRTCLRPGMHNMHIHALTHMHVCMHTRRFSVFIGCCDEGVRRNGREPTTGLVMLIFFLASRTHMHHVCVCMCQCRWWCGPRVQASTFLYC